MMVTSLMMTCIERARAVSPKRVLMLYSTGFRFGFWGVRERRQSENGLRFQHIARQDDGSEDKRACQEQHRAH